MRGAVRGSVKGCCRARRRALRSLFSLINFLPRTVPRPATLIFQMLWTLKVLLCRRVTAACPTLRDGTSQDEGLILQQLLKQLASLFHRCFLVFVGFDEFSTTQEEPQGYDICAVWKLPVTDRFMVLCAAAARFSSCSLSASQSLQVRSRCSPPPCLSQSLPAASRSSEQSNLTGLHALHVIQEARRSDDEAQRRRCGDDDDATSQKKHSEVFSSGKVTAADWRMLGHGLRGPACESSSAREAELMRKVRRKRSLVKLPRQLAAEQQVSRNAPVGTGKPAVLHSHA